MAKLLDFEGKLWALIPPKTKLAASTSGLTAIDGIQ